MVVNERVLFSEHLPVVGARIEALRAHGRAPAALRLAVSAARAMRHRQVRLTFLFLQLPVIHFRPYSRNHCYRLQKNDIKISSFVYCKIL